MNTAFIRNICLLAIIVLTSCQVSQEKHIAHLVNEWKGKEILFPKQSIFTVQGVDTVTYPIYSTPYKIIVFVDSVGCMSCKLQLSHWKEWIAYTDSLIPGMVDYYFYLYSSKVQEVKHLLRRSKFEHPVCIDTEGKMNKLNHFPKDAQFQTFLVDSTNKVIAVGNPVRNTSVKNLYLTLLTGQEAVVPSQPTTTVRAERMEIDLGNFSWKDEQTDSLWLCNTGKSLLVIHDITTNCGCLEVKFPREPIRPGNEACIKLRYRADHAEVINKVFHVYGNFEGNNTLTFKVNNSSLKNSQA